MYSFLQVYETPLQKDTFLSEVIKRFYAFARYHYKDKLDKRTIYLMLRHVEGYERFMYYQYPDIQNIESIKETHIYDFRNFCSEGLKNDRKTVNSKLTSLRYFFKYLTEEGLTPYNIVLNVNKLKNPEPKEPTFFKSTDLNILFSEMKKIKYGIRDIVISKIVLTTGLEIQEVLNLKLCNFNLKDKNLIVADKLYPLGDNLILSIKEYIAIRNTINPNGLEYMFLSQIGTVYSARSYQMFFKKAITETNIPVNLTPRYLRTTFLYNMARVIEEEDLKVLANQEKLNHYYELLKNPLQNLI